MKIQKSVLLKGVLLAIPVLLFGCSPEEKTISYLPSSQCGFSCYTMEC